MHTQWLEMNYQIRFFSFGQIKALVLNFGLKHSIHRQFPSLILSLFYPLSLYVHLSFFISRFFSLSFNLLSALLPYDYFSYLLDFIFKISLCISLLVCTVYISFLPSVLYCPKRVYYVTRTTGPYYSTYSHTHTHIHNSL